MKMTATYNADTKTFTMAAGGWTNTYPISELPKWLEFYRTQRELFPRHASYYDDDVEALEHLAAELRVRGVTLTG